MRGGPASTRTSIRPKGRIPPLLEDRRRESVYPLITVVAVAALITALRVLVLFLSDLDLDGDEAQYWTWAQTPAFGYFSKPPMIAWLIGASTAVCGDGEACVRIASPLLHGLTALVLFLLGRRLYDAKAGFWVSVTYLTLPGVWFSAGLITTDVPLLLFWSVALLAFHHVATGGRAAFAVLLGAAVGLGLLSKYAMLYFIGCALLYCLLTPSARWLFSSRKMLLASLVAIVIVLPNLVWNLQHGLVTFGHTAENAAWSRAAFRPGAAAEFLAAQFGVFGPLLTAVLILLVVRIRRPALPPETRMMLFFAVPVLVLVTTQAFISRAYANWAVAAYPAATVAVVATLIAAGRTALLKLSLAIHLSAAAALYAVAFGAVSTERIGISDPLAKVRGWETLAREVALDLDANPEAVLLVDERMLMAELMYYLRHREPAIRMWAPEGPPSSHFALTAPLRASQGRDVLLFTRQEEPSHITDRFARARRIRTLELRAGKASASTYSTWLLEGRTQ